MMLQWLVQLVKALMLVLHWVMEMQRLQELMKVLQMRTEMQMVMAVAVDSRLDDSPLGPQQQIRLQELHACPQQSCRWAKPLQHTQTLNRLPDPHQPTVDM